MLERMNRSQIYGWKRVVGSIGDYFSKMEIRGIKIDFIKIKKKFLLNSIYLYTMYIYIILYATPLAKYIYTYYLGIYIFPFK